MMRLTNRSIRLFSVTAPRLRSELRSWVEQPRTERLKDGVRVVIAGPPNSGKSSLINAVAGEERAIVTEIPGTTRDHIELPLAIGGVPVVLVDTAGLRETADRVEAIGVSRAAKLVELADVLIWLGEASTAPRSDHLVKVHAKADLPERGPAPLDTIAISTVSGEGIAELLKRVQSMARSLMPAEGAIALNRRQALHIEEAAQALEQAARANEHVLIAEDLRLARSAINRLTGAAGMEEVLDALFSRFCLGK